MHKEHACFCVYGYSMNEARKENVMHTGGTIYFGIRKHFVVSRLISF
uniref:Uncharacterized protein n=1 Tax=Arundo donax TaxID=35708 RepID=A0A0A9GPP8_ARUDO